MIISVSRRTDIPAFYVDWFLKRIEEGFFYVINPFNAHSVRAFSLSPEDVDVLVFWSKNPTPMLPHTNLLDSMGYRYYFQFTLNDYPRLFEPRVPSVNERIRTFRELSDKIGNRHVIWRYDPIIISSITPIEYHIEKFSVIAENLKGYTKRLVISFVDFYGKVSGRFEKLGSENNISFIDATAFEHRQTLHTLCRKIQEVAGTYGMEVFSCGEALDLNSFGIRHGSCIDTQLIKDLFGLTVDRAKDKNQRLECLCAESVDLGVYNTCKFRCAYCYANYSDKMIDTNLQKHKTESASLINEYHDKVPIVKNKSKEAKAPRQLEMFLKK